MQSTAECRFNRHAVIVSATAIREIPRIQLPCPNAAHTGVARLSGARVFRFDVAGSGTGDRGLPLRRPGLSEGCLTGVAVPSAGDDDADFARDRRGFRSLLDSAVRPHRGRSALVTITLLGRCRNRRSCYPIPLRGLPTPVGTNLLTIHTSGLTIKLQRGGAPQKILAVSPVGC